MDLFTLALLALALSAVIKIVQQVVRSKQMNDLRERSPEAWIRMQELEHQKEVMEHQRRAKRHDQIKTGMGVAEAIAKALMKK